MVQQLQNLTPQSPLEALLSGFTSGFVPAMQQRRAAEQEQAAKQQQQQQLFQMLGIEMPGTQPMQQDMQQQQEFTGVNQDLQGIQPMQEQNVPQGQGFDVANISDEQILAVTQSNPNLGKVLQQQKADKKKLTEGISTSETQKAFLGRNIDRGQALITKAEAEESTVAILNDLESQVKAGATDDIISNLVTEYDVKLLKPFLQKPGSKLFAAGVKELYADFKEKFGARPTQYEAMIFGKGLPDLLSPADTKLAAIYQARAIRQADIANSTAYNQAVEELGYAVSPTELNNRAKEIGKELKANVYEETRDQIWNLLLKDKELPEGKAWYYDNKNNRFVAGDPARSEEVKALGLRLINRG